ncbi:CDP-glycerol glycerophosphotransferase family protein [[Brevibacterium] frigoritolerans]|uniref:CDP-glycerol glycerophosphotransferase family protein n=1 Tax=Peribacillus frigoritolerans TaxID=450367 RepID=A0A941J4U9_9BACI|nr:CDP-glycerol glycerophosphotransferase family protein [Peribacillus frigoritolerans]
MQGKDFEVYGKFDYVTAGSERMAEIYQESFQLPASHILRTGIPRTDFFLMMNQKGLPVMHCWPSIQNLSIRKSCYMPLHFVMTA